MVIHLLGLLSYISLAIAFIVLARLSQRLGRVTHAKPYFIGLYIAAGLVLIDIVLRLFFITRSEASLDALNSESVYILVDDGLIAFAVTLALGITWYYWSWLLAERD